jgi:hypothetical protein
MPIVRLGPITGIRVLKIYDVLADDVHTCSTASCVSGRTTAITIVRTAPWKARRLSNG